MDRFPNLCSPNTLPKVTDRKKGIPAGNPRAAQSVANHASAGKDGAQRPPSKAVRLTPVGAPGIAPFQEDPTPSRRNAIVSHRSAGVLMLWWPKLFRPNLLQNALRPY